MTQPSPEDGYFPLPWSTTRSRKVPLSPSASLASSWVATPSASPACSGTRTTSTSRSHPTVGMNLPTGSPERVYSWAPVRSKGTVGALVLFDALLILQGRAGAVC